MKRFTATTLDKALLEASRYFDCSITQLEYEIIQNHSDGLFGLFKKEAIIIATKKQVDIESNKTDSNKVDSDNVQSMQTNEINTNTKETIKNDIDYPKDNEVTKKTCCQVKDNKENDLQANECKSEASKNQQNSFECKSNIDHSNNAETNKVEIEKNKDNEKPFIEFKSKTESDFDVVFYDKESTIPWQDSDEMRDVMKSKNMEEICDEVQKELSELMRFLPLSLNKIEVSVYDDHTLFILIDGLDAALLIGQKGYRYKSLSYLLFNWINTCYGYGVRLEIAQFLKNQEEMIRTYLEPIIESAKINSKAQTKPLDGVLTHIALKILRDALPNKYIVFRENTDGEKYITISDFLGSNNNRNNGFGNFPKY